jgi:hypothetical protein
LPDIRSQNCDTGQSRLVSQPTRGWQKPEELQSSFDSHAASDWQMQRPSTQAKFAWHSLSAPHIDRRAVVSEHDATTRPRAAPRT